MSQHQNVCIHHCSIHAGTPITWPLTQWPWIPDLFGSQCICLSFDSNPFSKSGSIEIVRSPRASLHVLDYWPHLLTFNAALKFCLRLVLSRNLWMIMMMMMTTWPWKTFQQYPLTQWMLVPSFIEIPPLIQRYHMNMC